VIRQVVDLACEAMRPGGVLLMEHSNLQGAAVADLLRVRGLRLVATEKDLVGRERFTHGVVG
jgi:release factor glutamine methyltransferase